MILDVDISGVELRTERLVLRAFRTDDLHDFFEYARVDGVGERAGWSHHKDIEESRRILGMFIEGCSTFAIEYEGKVIGSIGIDKYREDMDVLDAKKGRDIGFVIAKEHWGKGLMPEAVREVLRYLFDEAGADYLTCGYFDWNKQSARVQEKLGFEFFKTTKTKTIMGTEENLLLNVLTREQWKSFCENH